MTGHTPCPWRVEVGVSDPEMYSVKGSYLVADYLPIEDARLIAAAPDLLEACEAVFDWLGGVDDAVPIRDDLLRVIAKAEGRS